MQRHVRKILNESMFTYHTHIHTCRGFGWLHQSRCPPDTAQYKLNIHLTGGTDGLHIVNRTGSGAKLAFRGKPGSCSSPALL